MEWLTAIAKRSAGVMPVTPQQSRAGGAGQVPSALVGMAMGTVPLGGLATYLLWRAAPSPLESAAIGCAAAAMLAYGTALALVHARRDRDRDAGIAAREAEHGSLLQAVDDLVTWHDRNGRVLKASPSAQKLLGVPPAALHDQGLFARVHVADRPAFLTAISDAAAGRQPGPVTLRLHARPAGTTDARSEVLWAEMRVSRIEGEASSTDTGAVVAVTRDASDKIRHAEELDRARDEAGRVERARGQFLASVSHELRTPLNAIIGFAEVLAAEGHPAMSAERRREYVGIIRESGQHLLEVVNTLLDMSKIESGNFDFIPEPFDVRGLAHGCCDLMALKAEQSGVVLARDIAAELPEVVADRRACRQILINLLSNAVKFTPRGGRVTVAVRRERDRIVFVVSDDGIGIAEGDLPKLGDPFFQAGAAYDRQHEGTGLGLSVVRGLVGLHHGALAVESAPREGTAVTVTLPLDCRTGSRRTGGPVPIRTIPRPRRDLCALKAG
jgi:cell cycle sensor histidine kinase DivJ